MDFIQSISIKPPAYQSNPTLSLLNSKHNPLLPTRTDPFSNKPPIFKSEQIPLEQIPKLEQFLTSQRVPHVRLAGISVIWAPLGQRLFQPAGGVGWSAALVCVRVGSILERKLAPRCGMVRFEFGEEMPAPLLEYGRTQESRRSMVRMEDLGDWQGVEGF